MLFLEHAVRTARRETLEASELRSIAKGTAWHLDPLGKFPEVAGATWREQVGDEWLGGRRMKVFDSSKPTRGNWREAAGVRLWVDADTDLPARLRVINRPDNTSETIITDFGRWNAAFDPELFSTAVPAGYTLKP